ncbi:hypothetical protein GWI33_021604 [Rhynchophorus ferrugineus]|uniref:Uncharacterized protein n=1 Tax=Rhynchophorus ferrugineus TaxID=354439 RepID=A0A834IR18_RHYFE|nr:hypothetical protein GWI33_021604 [Rhynchophorus ferrugineus]
MGILREWSLMKKKERKNTRSTNGEDRPFSQCLQKEVLFGTITTTATFVFKYKRVFGERAFLIFRSFQITPSAICLKGKAESLLRGKQDPVPARFRGPNGSGLLLSIFSPFLISKTENEQDVRPLQIGK